MSLQLALAAALVFLAMVAVRVRAVTPRRRPRFAWICDKCGHRDTANTEGDLWADMYVHARSVHAKDISHIYWN